MIVILWRTNMESCNGRCVNMAYKRKYKRGKKITTLDELSKQKFIYHGNQILHCGWFMSWQVSLAQRYINKGWLYFAEKVSDEQ